MKRPERTIGHMPISLPTRTPVKAGTATHCPYCALQCGMNVTVDDTVGKTVTITPREDIPAGAGGLCQKGWTAGELLTSGERLTTPLLYGRPVGWDEALDFVADRIRAVQEEHGPNGVAVFGGGGLTNEKAYQLGKFARMVLKTSQIDYNGRFCMSSAAAATNRAFGMDRGLPFPITDLARADAVLLAGGNVAETMPPFVRHLTAMRGRGGRLIVIDPRVTATARQADLHLQPTPGTDLALALGLLHIVITEGHVDEDYVAARTSGFDAVRTSAAAWWPERVERITGVPVAQMRVAAAILGDADRAAILTGRGAEQHAKGTDTVSAFINLALALGLPGREGSGYGCVTGQGNGQEAVSTARRPTSFPDTGGSTIRPHGPMWPPYGASSRRTCRAPAAPPTNCWTRSAPPAGPGHCCCSARTRRSPRPGPGTSSSGSTRWTFSWSPTSSCRRRPRWPTSCCPPPSGPRRAAR